MKKPSQKKPGPRVEQFESQILMILTAVADAIRLRPKHKRDKMKTGRGLSKLQRCWNIQIGTFHV